MNEHLLVFIMFLMKNRAGSDTIGSLDSKYHDEIIGRAALISKTLEFFNPPRNDSHSRK